MRDRIFINELLFILLSLSFLYSCTEKEYDGEILDSSPVVVAIFQPQGLGDLGYNDEVYRGIQNVANEMGYRMNCIVPNSYQEATEILKKMLADQDEGVRYLYMVVADTGYDDFILQYGDSLPDDEFTSIVMLGMRDAGQKAYGLYLSLYGTFYEAGKLARNTDNVTNLMIISADSTITSSRSASDGFIEGFKPMLNDSIRTVFLNDNIKGFNMADELYEYAYVIDDSVDFVVPICGGSCQGLFRYNREHTQSFYTLGVDADMGLYSPLVPFSCVRHIDNAIYDWVKNWHSGNIARRQVMGLESGYVETVVSVGYRERLTDILSSIHSEAISKENEYEK
ncbi:MAG: hypothetical protein K6E54_02845 [Bacteroidaceae bacterium]|nr:hypothetical protein [Bacteroidaceae bacterium]